MHSIKGIARPCRSSGRRRARRCTPRREAHAPLAPLVGRDLQVALLLERWESRGSGQVVLISGEPGIGKSRLLEAVRERSSGGPHARLEASCSPYHQASPLYAIAQLVSEAAGIRPDDPADECVRRLEERVAAMGLPVPEAMPLLASLLGLPAAHHPMPPWTPQRIKQKTIESVLLALRAIAARQPLLLVVEDLHWVDASTLELLTLLVEQVPTAPICALFTARTEFSPSWAARSHTSHLMLDRLQPGDAESIVLGVAGDKGLPSEVLRQIVARTDGVPLFIEELTKMMLESQLLQVREDHYELTGPLPPLAIPMTLQDSLMSRLDRLATVRSRAQLGAVLGRDFFALLEAVSRRSRPFWRAGALAESSTAAAPPDSTYTFKHALIRKPRTSRCSELRQGTPARCRGAGEAPAKSPRASPRSWPH
jgi:predicted ATPase